MREDGHKLFSAQGTSLGQSFSCPLCSARIGVWLGEWMSFADFWMLKAVLYHNESKEANGLLLLNKSYVHSIKAASHSDTWTSQNRDGILRLNRPLQDDDAAAKGVSTILVIK